MLMRNSIFKGMLTEGTATATATATATMIVGRGGVTANKKTGLISPPMIRMSINKTQSQYNHFRKFDWGCINHQKRHFKTRQQHKQIRSINTHTNNCFAQKRGMMMMARSSMINPAVDPSKNSESKAMLFLVATLGYEERIAKGVIDALKQSGVSSDAALLSMVRTLAGRWEVDEDAGLEPLVESVTLELARSENKNVVTFWVVPSSAWPSKERDGEEREDYNKTSTTDLSRAFQVEGYEDMSLTDVAKFGDSDGAQVLGEMIECACSGIMACSTCHVVVAVSRLFAAHSNCLLPLFVNSPHH